MNVCYIGDSLVLGYGAPACLGWPGRVCARACAERLDVVCYNLGVRRSTTLEIRERWVDEAGRRLFKDDPGGLVFSFGVADAAQGVDPDETIMAARQIMEVAPETGTTLLVGPTPVRDQDMAGRIELLSRAFAGVCTDTGVPYLDLFTPLSQSRPYVADLEMGDGVHPGAAGYEAVAAMVWEWPAFQEMVRTQAPEG